MEILEKLKRRRAQARKSFTVSANKLEAALKVKPQELLEISSIYDCTKSYADILFDLENQVLLAWTDFPDCEEELDTDQDKAREYVFRWSKLRHEADATITTPMSPFVKSVKATNKHSDESSISQDSVSTCKSSIKTRKTHSSQRSEQRSELDWKSVSGETKNKEKGHRNNNLRLPKLELQKFNGDLKGWITFWGQFQQIDQNDFIDDQEKFQYLIQSTEEGSPARRLVQSYPPSAENYKKALTSLKERFGREDLLIEIYVRELLHLVSNRNKDGLTLGELFDRLVTQVKALETLGVKSNKYSAMLFPLVESAVPEDILKAWERVHCETDENLDSLLSFLKKEVRIEERLKISRKETEETHNLLPTATCLNTLQKEEKKKSEMALCMWCDKKHATTECLTVAGWTLEQRKDVLVQKRVCHFCFKNHGTKKCYIRFHVKCLVCDEAHQTLLCPNIVKIKEAAAENIRNGPSASNVAQFTIKTQSTVTLLQTLRVKVKNGLISQEVRAFIDSGAQRSYILHDTTTKLNLKPVGKEILGHCLFGGIETKIEEHEIFEFVVEDLKSGTKLKMSALQKQVITGNLPRLSRSHELMSLLKHHNIELSDYDDNNTSPIVELLIGADYLGAILTKELIHLDKGVIAVKTILGWTIQGPITNNACTVTNNVVVANNISISELWDLETLGIREPAKTPSESETSAAIMTKFRESVIFNEEGRYEVNLPWKLTDTVLLSNRDLAEKRLQSTTQRLLKLNEVSSYSKVFEEWLDLNIIESTIDDKNEGHYLSHHAVIKESSLTTRVRPVFNASAKDKNGISLNELLEKGVNYLEVIPKLLIRFRKHAIGITADIKKAFLQISLKPEDRKFLKFLWWKSDKMDEIIVYQHRRVVFGLTSSPFLLAATIIHHLEKYTTRFKDTAKQLLQSFYVDNCVTSVDTEEAAKKFIKEGKEVMLEGKFELRGWVTAPMENEDMTDNDKTISVLGLQWSTINDTIGCRLAPNESKTTKKPTQRDLMSVAQKIFDPVGITCPTTLIPKRLLQESYKIGCKLEGPLPESIIETFTKWLSEVEAILDCRRRLTENPINESSNELHIFCDASQKFYASCIFLRSEFKGEVSVKLVMAKSRVAPLEDITVPRLELLGALIASRLFTQVKEALDIECKTYFWTDSSVVLTWITTRGDWGVWVRNRVKEIRERTNPENWRHLPGSMNPADLPSRGCFPNALRESEWWKGPDWLKQDKEYWPKGEPVIDHIEVDKEKMKRATVNLIKDTEETRDIIQNVLHFSKYPKMVRMIAWVRRFLHNCRENEHRQGDISFEEYQDAEVILLKLVQKEQEGTGTSDIQTFKDSKGLIRISTKLLYSSDSPEFKTPIFLKGKHMVVRRLIEHTHFSLNHAGPGVTITQIRERYWIVAIRRMVKEVIGKCLFCKREKSKPTYIPPAPLPLNRINPTAIFEVTGIDLAGPLILRSQEKVWIVIFTCAVYRAIHLEMTNALSTEAFLMSLRRFIARRGRPNVIYTDNGTNFHGAANQLASLDWQYISALSNIQKMKWIFNPPSAPWWGGFWERLIRSVKDLLKRNLGSSVVDYEELFTLICECESLINARPLTFVSDDLCRPLSPDCFLKMVQNSTTDDLDEIDHKSFNVRHKYVQKLRQDLRDRFRSEYLALLTQRRTNTAEVLKIGDVVLIETPEKRIHWPMGVIQELVKGQDGTARVAKVKTKRGVIERPVQRLHQLELSEKDQQHEIEEFPDPIVQECSPAPEAHEPKQLLTSRGRVVRLPQRFR